MGRALALGLDIGTSRIKACVVDGEGEIGRVSAVATPFAKVRDGVEMSPGDLFRAVRECLTGLGEDLDAVVSVGIATMGETGGMIVDGNVTGMPLLAWHDPRGADMVARLSAAFGSNLHTRTGRRVRTVSSVAKLGWLAEHGADLRGHWTGIGGLIAWRLTGNVAQEASLAATSGAFDPFSRIWDREIIREAGLTRVHWPEVVRAVDPVGRVGSSGADWSGLPAGASVCIAGHDHPVGVVGVGGRPIDIIDSMGTGEPLITGWEGDREDLERHVAGPPIDGDLTITPWPGADGLMLLWEMLNPGLARASISRAVGRSQEDLDDAALHDDDSVALPLAAATLRELEDGVVPSLEGRDSIAYWKGMLAGYASCAARAEDWIRMRGEHGDTLLIGGGLRSAFWVREKVARAAHRPKMVGQQESVAYGAALLGGVPAGFWPVSGLPRAVRNAVP